MSTNGVLGSRDLLPAIPQAIYVNNNDTATILTLNVVNKSNVPATIRVTIGTSATVQSSDSYIEFDTQLLPKGVLERNGLIVSPGYYVVVMSSASPCNAVCWGVEQGTQAYFYSITTNNSASTPTFVTASGTIATAVVGAPGVGVGSTVAQVVATDPNSSSLTYTVSGGSLPTGMALSPSGEIQTTTGISGSYTPGGITSNFTVTASNGTNSTSRAFSIIKAWRDGSTPALAGTDAATIKSITGLNTDGVYYINLPTVGPTPIYCVMNSAMSGGGWMMMMKATTSSTFQWSSTHWTSVSTLNTASTDRSNADSKFDTMNYFAAKDIMALWPGLSNGGDIGGQSYGTVWIENNYYGGNRITPIAFFGAVNNYNPNGLSVRNSKWNGGSQFSSQSGNQAYGFNLQYNVGNSVRWGWQWNNETDWGSNDVSNGIGMARVAWSAGDSIGCCADVTGFNSQQRVEMYVR